MPKRAKVDALNEAGIDNYLQNVVAENGKLDMVFNGIGSYYKDAGSGTPTTLATFEQFLNPLQRICGSQFLTSRVAAKHMIRSGSEGTILLLTASMSQTKTPNMAGFASACAAIEGLTRVMAAEFGQHGIKSICIRSGALMETNKIQGMISDFSQLTGISPGGDDQELHQIRHAQIRSDTEAIGRNCRVPRFRNRSGFQ